MSVRLQQNIPAGGIYFITFTCFVWKPLFQLTNAYDVVYKWFDYLIDRKASILGYVIMPNHLHLLGYLPSTFKSVNTVIGNAKRFLAYEIIKRLEEQKQEPLLQELHAAVKAREAKKGQIHKVFEESFDAKECFSPKFIVQKLGYIHANPVRGRWKLVDDFALFPHSSAGFYYVTDATVYKRITRVEEVGGNG